jgi:hypothetical protein
MLYPWSPETAFWEITPGEGRNLATVSGQKCVRGRAKERARCPIGVPRPPSAPHDVRLGRYSSAVSRPAAAGAAGGAPGCADTSEGLCCPFSWNGVSREQSAPTGPHARLAPHLRVARDTSKLITSGCAVIHSLSHDVIVRHPMFLTPVTRLVPHEILAPHRTPKVRYRAQDTRLGCGVALKNLLAAVTGDPARHQRFEQEGRAVPALSRLNRLRVDPFRCDVLQRRCR